MKNEKAARSGRPERDNKPDRASSRPKLLIIEDDPGLSAQLRWVLSDFETMVADTCDAGLQILQRERPRIVILDLGLPPHPDDATEGLRFLRSALALRPATKIIVASGNEDHANALEAISLGAYDFCAKPVEQQVLKTIVQRALNLCGLEEEIQTLKGMQQNEPLAGLIAASPEMFRVCRMIERVSSSNVGIMITGESGTDLAARAIHRLSPRKDHPFIAINCAAIPENLLESELFGHERGAFTGAVRQVIGKIECANRGTLFLDEIGDMAPALQAKLLRFLQDKTVVRVGGHRPIDVDVRVIAATNQDLTALMEAGKFREDLFYRLNEIGIHMPPLRERAGDAVLIAQFLLRKHRLALNSRVAGFTAEAISLIEAHPWPGNVRELENRVKRAVVMAESKQISAADLGLFNDDPAADGAPKSLREIREDAERRSIIRTLAQTSGNMSQAAKLLDISRPTLYGMLKTLQITRVDP
jgi:two-component system NtrC family response regulator